jgi:putative FmdB family regulatory protein
MPIYEYECVSCHHHFENFQRSKSDEVTDCPKCGSDIERKMSLTSFSLKGGGWYKDGYAKSGSSSGSCSTPSSGGCQGCPSASS